MNTLIDIATAQIIQAIINNTFTGPNGEKTPNYTWENITGGSLCLPDPPAPGNCTNYWRVSKASCWRWYQNPDFRDTLPPDKGNYWGAISYCEYDICCLTYYRVCYDQFMQLVVTEVEENSNGQCPHDPTGQCQSVCD